MLEYWMDNWTVSDVTGHAGVIGQYLANAIISDDPVPISEPRQSLIAPCLGLGAHEAIAGYTEFSLQRCQ